MEPVASWEQSQEVKHSWVFFLRTLTAPTARPALRWWWFLLGVLPQATLSILWGAIGIPSPFLCPEEGAFWTRMTEVVQGVFVIGPEGLRRVLWEVLWEMTRISFLRSQLVPWGTFLTCMDSLPLRFKKKIRNCLRSSGLFACEFISSGSMNYIVSGLIRISLNATYVEHIDFYLTLDCSSAFQAWSTSGKCSSMHISQIPWLKFKLVRDDKFLSRCIQWPLVSFAFLQ